MDGDSSKHKNTNFTSETLRLELRDNEKVNTVPDLPIIPIAMSSQGTQKRKTASFQITSVVCNDGGEESPDETENDSDILDSSKLTSDFEQETPSFSEDYSKSEDMCLPPNVIPTNSQYGITAVLQQTETGGLLTSRLPQGITVNVTKGGIALAEPDGAVTNDSDNLSNRFKIVKINSNKPFKKGRWMCLDFMDTPAMTTIARPSDLTQGVTLSHMQPGVAPSLQHKSLVHSQTSQNTNAAPSTLAYSSHISNQGFHGTSSTTVSHGAAQIALQQQIQQQQSGQVVEGQQQGNDTSVIQHINSSVNQSSPITGGSSATPQQTAPPPQEQIHVLQQNLQSQNVSTGNQQIGQLHSQSQPIQNQQQIHMQQQHMGQQQPQQLMPGMQSQQQGMQSNMPSQDQQIHLNQDHSPMSLATGTSYQSPPAQPQLPQSSVTPQSQVINATQQSPHMQNTQQIPTTSSALSQVPQSIPSSTALPLSGINNVAANISNFFNSQIGQQSILALAQTDGSPAEGTANVATDAPGVPSGEEGTTGEEDKPSASAASTVAIDNKIEQAMDLVKSHLMFAVREEVDVLKERIGELKDRINHLEYENTVLRQYATQEALQQLQHPPSNNTQ